MKKACAIFLTTWLMAFLAQAAPAPALSVGGAVRQPLHLTLADLHRYDAVEVRLNDLTRAREYNGAFHYRGVPLRYLLEAATIAKDGAAFPKPTDMAIVIRNRAGKRTVLSWGEVFYRNPSNVVIAYAAQPVMPHRPNACSTCHAPDFYQPVLDTLQRPIAYPKLVLANDFYADRCLEDIVSIEVVETGENGQKSPAAASAEAAFIVRDMAGNERPVSSLSGHATAPVTFRIVGDGLGWHGISDHSGVPLPEVIRAFDDLRDMDKVLLITSKDGYRSTFSFGEIFLNPLGRRLVVCPAEDGPPGEKNYALITPDDQAADRMIKAIDTIDILTLKQAPHVTIVSVGCGDPNLITLEALSAMGRADAFIASERTVKKFARYMDGKPVLFDPMQTFEPIFRKNHPGLAPDELQRQLAARRAADAQTIRDALAAGKNIALLEHGDPTVYGGWQHWIEPVVDGRFEVVTGVSAYNAANAMFANHKVFTGISAFNTGNRDNLVCNQGTAILSAPRSLAENEAMLQAIAASGDTLAIFMGLNDIDTLVPLLTKHYPATTPAAIAYQAGYAHQSRLVMTTLGDLRATVQANPERMAGMIYLGRCLEKK